MLDAGAGGGRERWLGARRVMVAVNNRWTPEELHATGTADRAGAVRRNARAPTTIWVVPVSDHLYVRSWRGPFGGWSKAAQATRVGHATYSSSCRPTRPFVSAC